MENSEHINVTDRRKEETNIFHPSLVFVDPNNVPDPNALELNEERAGWHGYIEWEKYPERKLKAMEYLRKFNFPPVSLVFSQYAVRKS